MEMLAELDDFNLYIEDIRSRAYRLAIGFVAVFAVGFFAAGFILNQMIRFFKLANVTIAATSPFQYFDLAMDVGFFCAVLILAPFAIYEAYSFLKSALTSREQKLFLKLLPVGLLLFVSGFAYGFFTLYISLSSLAKINTDLGITNMWDIGKFAAQVSLTGALLGILFQLPLVATFLIRVGAVSVDFLKQKRRHAIVAIFIFVSLLPPTDVLSLLILTLPLLIMYEVILIINRAYKSPEESRKVYV
jgi:sec-independent protein translocase protein TatC